MVVKDNGGDFETPPLGIQRAICVNVFDVGLQPGYQGGPAARKVVLLWELEARMENGKRFQVTKIYTQSIGAKSNLGADLESWRTKPFTEEERKGFDLDAILRKPCQLNLVANGDRAKVAMVLPADKSEPYWDIETPSDYVPKFVAKMRDEQLVSVPKHGIETVAAGADGFADDIPFDQGPSVE